ncbi:MAG TPA: carbonic anhydrase [Methylophilaceae bacterium]
MTEINKLIEGYKRFRDNYFVGDKREQLFAELSQGQNPNTLVIACSDSRVDPAIIMDSKPGDLFVIRNVANLVPPYEIGGGYHGVSAALEFAVRYLKVEHVIVLGHQHCGGIKSLVSGMPEGERSEFIQSWVNIAQNARQSVLKELPHASENEQLCACEKASILVSLENLRTFPWVRQAVSEGKLNLHGWYFDIDKGALSAHDQNTSSFVSLV